MGLFEILSLILSVFGSGMAIYAQDQANQQNVTNANAMLDKQQQYAQGNAATANQATQNLYYSLYSPKAQVKQLKEAGLSPGLFYSHGGGTVGTAAAQATASTAQVPTINPVVDNAMINRIVEATKTASETTKNENEAKKTATEIDQIKQNIEESKTKIKQMETQIGNTEVSTANMRLEGKLLELQTKFQEGTVEEQIQTVKTSLELLENQRDQAWEMLEQMKVDTKYKEQFKQKEFEYLDEQTKLVVNQQALVLAQTLKEQAQAELMNKQAGLTEKQAEELQRRIDAIDRFSYMVVNGNGWQDRIINGLMQMATEIGEFLGRKKKK